MPRPQRLRWIQGGLLSSAVMRSISFGFAVLTAVLLTACAIDNPTDVRLPDAGPCGTMGAACCPTAPTAPNGARTICRASGTTCSAGTCVACGAPGQPCCAGAATGDGGTSMDAGLAGSCTGAGVACLANMCVDCSGPDRAVCNGVCVPLTTNQNCGACGTTCMTGSGEQCVRPSASGVDGGVTDAGSTPDGGARVAFCQIQCPPGQVLCGNTCRDLTNDPNNCRTCGNQCNLPGAVPGCTGSACVLLSCRDGFGNCDNVATNGCETTTATDVMNCGVCGTRCSFANAATTCAAGRCMRGACNPGFADCDGNPANGCEVNTATGDITNCGTCGMRCPPPPVGGTAVCTAGACRISTVVCSVGIADCDGLAPNGCEITTLNDVNNCGIGGNGMGNGCGHVCSSTGGTAACNGGVCSITCNSGLGNCDGNLSNGCETNTNTTVAHCGGCGRGCTVINGTAGCAAGACTVAACAAGFFNCDGMVANGCEINLNSDNGNCGACGRVCPGGQTCQMGTCTTSCSATQVNCSGTCVNPLTDNNNCGPLTMGTGVCGRVCPGGQSCQGGACTTTCSLGQTVCSGTCRDLQTDNTNCGACARTCTGGTACSAGNCLCPAGQTGCSGTCRALQTDNNNCGVCGRVCGGGQTCVAGVCTTTCSAAQTDCSGTCRDLATDNTNCGACGAVCTGGTSCSGRSCVCPAGQTNCSGTCRALTTDNSNCGACGTVCGAGTVCSAGACTSTCASPTTNCSGVCRDLQNDANNCNACGTVCTRANGVAGCAAGACTLAACNSGFGNCDGNNANGCETSTSTSVTNCGVCGNSCQFANAAASCVAGRCTRGTCATGFANCDGVDSNGCEVNTVAGDVNNCGACNNRCPTPPIGSIAVCANSVCTTSSVSCSAGTADCDGAPGNGCEVATTTVSNCGACGRACVGTNGTATCTSQLCGITCSAGFGNCNGVLSDGCETNTTTSPTNCGGCNTVCSLANATAGCAASMCTIASCNAGFANCDGTASNGCERNLNSDTSNCGACGNVCSAGQLCSAGVCVTSCGSGQTNCSSVCRNLATDPDACGACGTVCSGTGLVSRTCGASVCNGTCSAGRADCDSNRQLNGCETDINTSVATCGACTGSACSSNNIAAACSGGNCTGTCNVGFADCNSDKRADGCEINTTNNASNCGACGTVCPARANAAATPCVSSACTIGACIGTFANCNGLAADGCEINTASDVNNCSGCGNPCPARANATRTCSSSSCGFTCNTGFGDCDSNPANGCETTLDGNPNCGACGTSCTGGPMCTAVAGMPGVFSCQ
jgi:hypothetical protein